MMPMGKKPPMPMGAGMGTGGDVQDPMQDEMGAKSKVLAELLEYLKGGEAQELKNKYAPPEAPKPKLMIEAPDGNIDKGIPNGPAGSEDADPESMLAELDPAVLEKLLNGGM